MPFVFPINSAAKINFILLSKVKITAMIHTTEVLIIPYSVETDFLLIMNPGSLFPYNNNNCKSQETALFSYCLNGV